MYVFVMAAIPVILIGIIIAYLKPKPLLAYLLIFVFGMLPPAFLHVFYCAILETRCEPEALSAVGYVIYSITVIAPSMIIYAFMPTRFKTRQ